MNPSTPSRFHRFKHWFILIVKSDNLPPYLMALFTLILAVFAIFAWREARKSTAAIEGQLAIMRIEGAPFVWQKNDLFLFPTYDDKNHQVKWDYHYENFGKGVAYNVGARSYIKIGDERYQLSYGTIPSSEGTTFPSGSEGYKTAYSRRGITKDYFERMLKINWGVGLRFDITYSSDPTDKYITSQIVCYGVVSGGTDVQFHDAKHCPVQ